jgi:DNA-binding PadR family transcriptional regulator
MTPATLHILLALAGGELHGYALMREVAAQSDGAVKLGPGTLYAALARMLDAGLIAEVDGPAGDERRRSYRLTARGRAAADAEVERLRGLVRRARRRLARSS